MRKYIVKRLLLSVMILFCVSFIIYTLMRCLPGSFVETRAMQLSQGAGAKSYDEWMEQLNASYGLDKPIVLGFVTWVGDALKGNFGDSWKYTVPVLDKFKEVIWLSFVMGAISFILQLIIAIPLGVVASRLPDHSRCIDGYFAADLLFRNAVKAAVLRKAGLV